MQLTVNKRTEKSKGAIHQMRREGKIPAVMYSGGNEGLSLVVDGIGFQTAMRAIKPGMLSTTVFTLDLDKKKTKVIVKGIQYDLTKYNVIHLDFEELNDDVPVKINVPVVCVGSANSPGIKAGGAFRQITNQIRVECLPKDIPTQFEVDVSNLNLWQSKRISDISMPNGVTPITGLDEVIAVVAKQ